MRVGLSRWGTRIFGIFVESSLLIGANKQIALATTRSGQWRSVLFQRSTVRSSCSSSGGGRLFASNREFIGSRQVHLERIWRLQMSWDTLISGLQDRQSIQVAVHLELQRLLVDVGLLELVLADCVESIGHHLRCWDEWGCGRRECRWGASEAVDREATRVFHWWRWHLAVWRCTTAEAFHVASVREYHVFRICAQFGALKDYEIIWKLVFPKQEFNYLNYKLLQFELS